VLPELTQTGPKFMKKKKKLISYTVRETIFLVFVCFGLTREGEFSLQSDQGFVKENSVTLANYFAQNNSQILIKFCVECADTELNKERSYEIM
jgi:hypothetical protein